MTSQLLVNVLVSGAVVALVTAAVRAFLRSGRHDRVIEELQDNLNPLKEGSAKTTREALAVLQERVTELEHGQLDHEKRLTRSEERGEARWDEITGRHDLGALMGVKREDAAPLPDTVPAYRPKPKVKP